MKAIKTFCLATLVAPVALSASTLRVLLVGDTNDRSIGKSVVTDLVNFEKFVRDAAQKSGMTLDLKILKGAEIKSKIITNAVNQVKADPDDAVIFYYSGHGFRTKQVTTKWPLLYIPDAGTKGVDFQWVVNTLDAKKPRFILAITDSCNSFIDTPARSVNTRAMQQDQDAAWKKLFAEFSGRIYASGSIVGQYSFGQDATGGAFTSRFLGIVRGETTKAAPTWEHIMKAATQKIPINSPQQKSQDPQYELVKGQTSQTPQSSMTFGGPSATPSPSSATAPTAAPEETEHHEITEAHEETSEEHNEMCQNLSDFHGALTQIKSSMPAKFDFKKQRSELSNYEQLVTALVNAGGDKQMINLSKTMQTGLKTKNWPRFRSAVWAYEGHIGKLQQEACASN